MEDKYCQSCAMPMGDTEEMYGTEADGTKSEHYCHYCFANGEFTANVSMDEMIEMCIPYMCEGNSGMSKDEARRLMTEYMPKLDRWK